MATTSGLDSAKPLTGNTIGDMYYATDTGVWYRASTASEWVVDTPNINGQISVESLAGSKVVPETVYSGSPVWTGTTAPSGATTHSYRWTKIGNRVDLNIHLAYANAGSALTQCLIPLPTDCPTPDRPNGSSAASSIQYPATGYLSTGLTAAPVASRAWLQANAGNTGFNIVIVTASTNARVAFANITYYTS